MGSIFLAGFGEIVTTTLPLGVSGMFCTHPKGNYRVKRIQIMLDSDSDNCRFLADCADFLSVPLKI